MRVINTKEPVILLIGDILVLISSLWITLFFRLGQLPTRGIWLNHFIPFVYIFFVWIFIFYIAGLYEKHTSILKNKISIILFNAQLVASVLTLLFFYLIPYFAITPKTILGIFIGVSFLLLYVFRVFVYSRIFIFKKQNALIIGSGEEVSKLFSEINSDKQYGLHFAARISLDIFSEQDFEEKMFTTLESKDISVVVLDLHDKNIEPFLPKLYTLLFKKVFFIDLYQVYEDVYDKVPIALIQHGWFIEHVSASQKLIYDILKRFIDIVVSIVGGMFTLFLYPFIIFALKMENPKNIIFISQIRVGKNKLPIKIYKFRSMNKNEDGVWLGESQNKITPVGRILRKSSIDEFPQFWNILKGDLSLVGPRPDMMGLEARLTQEIPYYAMRYIVKPGLTGWAQTKQDIIPNSIEENKERLAYDLYYIKNRSFFLDIQIILKTLKALLTRGGR